MRPFFVAGDTGDEICSLSDEQLAGYVKQFAQLDEDITPEEIESYAGMSIAKSEILRWGFSRLSEDDLSTDLLKED